MKKRFGDYIIKMYFYSESEKYKYICTKIK